MATPDKKKRKRSEEELSNEDDLGTEDDNRPVLAPLVDNNLAHFEEDEAEKYRKERLSKKSQRRHSQPQSPEDQDEIDKKKELASKGMAYLLGQSLTYSNYFKDKLQKRGESNHETEKPKGKSLKKSNRKSSLKKTVEDVVDNQGGQSSASTGVTVSDIEHLKYFAGVLKHYQVEGVMWLTILFENGINGILADEMGLGKTVQVIALICYLYEKHIKGPFLVVAPLSTIPNWMDEFKRFSPKIPVVVFQGDKENRSILQCEIEMHKYELDGKLVAPVIITSYQMPLKESHFLAKYEWQYIIIDEGHRLKNHESKLSQELRRWTTNNKLLLTGTPLQNNLEELWALLNFVMPDVFVNLDSFNSLLLLKNLEDDNKLLESEETTGTIKKIHDILAPFMLRRLKSEVLQDLVPKKEVLVYCPLSKLQRDLYKHIVQHNVEKLEGREEQVDEPLTKTRGKRKCTERRYIKYADSDDDEDLDMDKVIEKQETTEEKVHNAEYIFKINMQNPQAMLRKVVNHPYLVHFPLDPNSSKRQLLVDEQLVQQSGKMMVLDAMLARLKEGQHKVLIFSTMVMVLDQIEEYMLMRKYNYCRLDGRNNIKERQESVQSFNTDPELFVFLISSRAGGLGLNLPGADTVILFDRDWNPQVDIQAQDRCHRIGQTKPVMVYSLVTKNTIDEHIIKRGNMKRKMEKLVIKDRNIKSMKEGNAKLDLEELRLLLKSNDCTFKMHTNGYVLSDEELDAILDRTELYKQMSKLDQPSTSTDS